MNSYYEEVCTCLFLSEPVPCSLSDCPSQYQFRSVCHVSFLSTTITFALCIDQFLQSMFLAPGQVSWDEVELFLFFGQDTMKEDKVHVTCDFVLTVLDHIKFSLQIILLLIV